MKVLSGSSNAVLAERIADALGGTLIPREIFIFPDGERRVRVEEKIVDEHVVIVQPTSPPVDTHYLELFFLADAVKRSGALSVTAVVPYLGYQRQDHVFRDGEAVSLDVMVKIMESVSIDRVITCDLHSIKIPEFFHIPLIHLSALPLFAKTIQDNNWIDGETLLVTPDMGGIRRIKILSELLGNMPYSSIVKNRNLATGEVEAVEIEGDVKKRMIIVDDMISSGGTIQKAAELLIAKGAEEVYVFVTHAIFSDEAPKILQAAEVRKIFITDSVFVPKEKKFEKLTELSLGSEIATTLKNTLI